MGGSPRRLTSAPRRHRLRSPPPISAMSRSSIPATLIPRPVSRPSPVRASGSEETPRMAAACSCLFSAITLNALPRRPSSPVAKANLVAKAGLRARSRSRSTSAAMRLPSGHREALSMRASCRPRARRTRSSGSVRALPPARGSRRFSATTTARSSPGPTGMPARPASTSLAPTQACALRDPSCSNAFPIRPTRPLTPTRPGSSACPRRA